MQIFLDFSVHFRLLCKMYRIHGERNLERKYRQSTGCRKRQPALFVYNWKKFSPSKSTQGEIKVNHKKLQEIQR